MQDINECLITFTLISLTLHHLCCVTIKMPLNQNLYIDSWIHGLNMIGSFQDQCLTSKRSLKLVLCVPNTKFTNSQKNELVY